MCCGNVASCEITLTTCCYVVRHLSSSATATDLIGVVSPSVRRASSVLVTAVRLSVVVDTAIKQRRMSTSIRAVRASVRRLTYTNQHSGYTNSFTLQLSLHHQTHTHMHRTTSAFHQAIHANSASYPQCDGKCVPAKVR